LAVVLCASSIARANSLERYKEKGVCITGSNLWKPYSFNGPDDQPQGFYIDYWKKWSEKTQIPVKFKLVSWKESITMIADGECDIQSGLFETDSRHKILDFSRPFFHTSLVLAVGKGDQWDTEIESVRWGVVEGTASKDILSRVYPRVEVIEYRNSFDLFTAMSKGEILAAVDNWSSVALMAKEMGMADALTISRTMNTEELHAGVQKGNIGLLRIVNEGLSEITDKEHRSIVNRWFIDTERAQDWPKRYTPAVIVLALLLMGIFALKCYMKRRSGQDV